VASAPPSKTRDADADGVIRALHASHRSIARHDGGAHEEMASIHGDSFEWAGEPGGAAAALASTEILPQLAAIGGMDAGFWMGLQADDDLWHALRDVDLSKIMPLKKYRLMDRVRTQSVEALPGVRISCLSPPKSNDEDPDRNAARLRVIATGASSPHSVRSASTGLRRAARRAGIRHAASTIAESMTGIDTNVTRSSGVTSKRTLARSPLTATAKAIPIGKRQRELPQTGPEHQPDDITSGGPQRDSDADFLRPLAGGVGRDGVDADRRRRRPISANTENSVLRIFVSPRNLSRYSSRVRMLSSGRSGSSLRTSSRSTFAADAGERTRAMMLNQYGGPGGTAGRPGRPTSGRRLV
jgi:hypothetical protein